MRLNQLKINSIFHYYSKKYIVLQIEPPDIVIKRLEDDGETLRMNFFQLVGDPSFMPGDTMSKEVDIQRNQLKDKLDALSEKSREKVSKRYKMIEPILLLTKAKVGDIKSAHLFMQEYMRFLDDNETIYSLTQAKLINKISQQYGMSERTIKRYLSNYRGVENGYSLEDGEVGLIPKYCDITKSRSDEKCIPICNPRKPDVVLDILKVRLDDKYIPIIKESIENHCLNPKGIPYKAVYDYIDVSCKKRNFETPPQITIYKMLERLDEQLLSRLRKGKKASEKFDPIQRGFTNNEALYPLHIIQIDHKELDILVIDEKTGRVLKKPWLTAGIDLYSREIWCAYISLEPPSINRTIKALQHGVFFKRAKERYGTREEWGVYGIPTNIMFDNGGEFRSPRVIRIINEVLKANVMYRPVGTPRYGSAIERFFRTLDTELIHRLDGTTKSSFREWGDYEPSKEAAYTLDDIRYFVTKYITDIYQCDVHEGLPPNENTPLIRYEEGLKKTGFPEFVNIAEEESFRIKLLPSTDKPYTRDGIRLGNVLYRTDELSHLISSREIKYKVKYDDDDISRVYLLPPKSDTYVEVPAVIPSATELLGVNRYTYEKVLESLRIEGEVKRSQIPSTRLITTALAELQDQMEQRGKNNKKLITVAKRMGLDSSRPIQPSMPPQNKEKTVEELVEEANKAGSESESNAG